MLGGGVVSTSELDERLNRALTVYLRQEVQAPATAVTEFLDMIIEDARGHKLDHMLSDLERMHGASVRLNTFVKGLIDNSASDRKDDETPEAFHKRLRHDLRTPLNAIIGYSELLMEDTEADDNHPLRGDLVKLKQSADYLLSQIDAMVALTQDKAFGREKERAPQLDVIADVLRTVAPLK
jgi:signal transduction histidine kinase